MRMFYHFFYNISAYDIFSVYFKKDKRIETVYNICKRIIIQITIAGFDIDEQMLS